MTIIGAIDPIAAAIGICGALAGLLGAYAAYQAKRVEAKSVSRQEMEAALKAQGNLIERYRQRIDDLEREMVQLREETQRAARRCDALEESAQQLSEERDLLRRELREAEMLVDRLRGPHGS